MKFSTWCSRSGTRHENPGSVLYVTVCGSLTLADQVKKLEALGKYGAARQLQKKLGHLPLQLHAMVLQLEKNGHYVSPRIKNAVAELREGNISKKRAPKPKDMAAGHRCEGGTPAAYVRHRRRRGLHFEV